MIEIRDLYKKFQGKEVLRGINLTIPEGESQVIMGCSGCGKTVLLRILIGLLEPDRGEVRIDGQEISSLNREELFLLRKKFGMLFQGAALFDSMTVLENVGLALKEHSGLENDRIRKQVMETLSLVGLHDIEEKKPEELSGGMKKRVGLARALIMNPKYVLFDEPTTGLDPIMASNINNLIKRTHKKLKITSIIVTHDMVSAFKVGSRIAMIQKGRIVFQGSVVEMKNSRHPFIQKFMGGGYLPKF